MSVTLLEEFLEGSERLSREAPGVRGALFKRALSEDELEAVAELALIGDGAM